MALALLTDLRGLIQASGGGVKRAVGEGSGEASMGRVAFASFIGTAIEFYDFYIYGTAAALAFATVSCRRGWPEAGWRSY